MEGTFFGFYLKNLVDCITVEKALDEKISKIGTP